jgi:hypothetical protein
MTLPMCPICEGKKVIHVGIKDRYGHKIVEEHGCVTCNGSGMLSWDQLVDCAIKLREENRILECKLKDRDD